MTQVRAETKLEMDVQRTGFTVRCKVENWNAKSLFGEDTFSFFLLTVGRFPFAKQDQRFTQCFGSGHDWLSGL